MIAGSTTLFIGIATAAQFAAAQSSSPSLTADDARPVPTQACLQAMVALDDAHLLNFDAMSAKHKDQMKLKRDALAVVAGLTDETERREALQKMHEDMKAQKPNPDDVPAAIKTAMENVKSACGDTFHGGMKFGGPMMMGGHRGKGMLGMFGRGHGMRDMEKPETDADASSEAN